jgi:hypothetical protein
VVVQDVTMPRLFLIASLLFAQAISWNASPLFLCFDGDGEVSIDLGPSSCNCCRHQHGLDDDHASPEERVGDTSCNCTHLQLTVPWTAVTVTSDATHSVGLSSLAAFVVENGKIDSLLHASHESTILVLSDVPSRQSSARTAILRC